MKVLFGNFGERELILTPPSPPKANPRSIQVVMEQIKGLIEKC